MKQKRSKTKKKILFFDIDGTLWDFYNVIPESAVDAIHRAKANGHLVFINSGRSRAFIRSRELLSIGFDGIVSGCGTMVEYRDETIFYHQLDNVFAADVIRQVRSFGFRPVLEGRRYLYLDENEFENEPYGRKLRRELGDDLLGIEENWGNWEISKMSCATRPNEHEDCIRALEDDFLFMIHSPEVVEMAPKGFDKGSGIRRVCEYFGMDPVDTVAFGDSANDMTMLETAGTAVVMGNGSEEAKSAADLVTHDLHDDGIFYACRKLNLI